MAIETRTTVPDQQPSCMRCQRLSVERSQEAKLQLERSEPLLLLSRMVELRDEQLHVLLERLLDRSGLVVPARQD